MADQWNEIPAHDDPRWHDADFLRRTVDDLVFLRQQHASMVSYLEKLAQQRDEMETLNNQMGASIKKLLPVLRRAADAGYLEGDPADWWKE